jgi:hypothetical protein
MVGGGNITDILTGGVMKAFEENIVMGWVHGGWQKFYSYTKRGNCEGVWRDCSDGFGYMVGDRNNTDILTGGVIKGFEENIVMGWVHGG